MKQHTFKSHDEYIGRQQRLTRRNVERGRNPFYSEDFLRTLPQFKVKRGLCHGVRYGSEVDFMQGYLGGVWIGTEIYEPLCDGKKIIHHDFTQVVVDWVGRFDAVYSNTFDHARFPKETARVWIEQINETGRLLVEWSDYHNKLGIRNNKADCFAATLEEYRDIFDSVGNVESVLEAQEPYVNRRGRKRTRYRAILICTKRK